MEQCYTAKRGWFKKVELAKLASALGFPSDLFLRELGASPNSALQYEYSKLQCGKSISERNLRCLLESGALNYRLEKTFNKHDADYNTRAILKAMSFLNHRQLSYDEISEGRLAFEVYSVEDGSGLPAQLKPVSQALKLMNRVMSPSKLEAEIQKQQHICDLPSRIQLYEFLDLAIKCTKSQDAEREMEQHIIMAEKEQLQDDNDTCLPDISKMLMTNEQQVLDYLNKRYRSSLVKRHVDSSCPVPLDDKRIVSMVPRRKLRSLSREHSCALLTPLERSQQQLHQARSGKMVLSSNQANATVERISRPNTSLSWVYRSRGSGRLTQLSTDRQIPRERLPSVEDPMRQSKSAPNILLGSSTELCHRREGNDLTATISKICVGSVHRAREMLGSTFDLFSKHELTTSALPEIEHVTMVVNTLPKREGARVNGVSAIVSKDDLRRHQDRMSELQWERLKMHNYSSTN